MTESADDRVARWALRALWLGIGVLVVVLAVVAFGRPVFNYGTETDYLGSFIGEAARLLRGEALEVKFHPPLYPAAVAAVYAVARDWFGAGLLLSLLSSLAALAATLLLLRRMFGIGAAAGGVLALAISPTFLYYSMQATSEAFSFAIYMVALASVWWSVRRRTTAAFLVAGVVMGLALLTRTNHLVILGFLLFYLAPVHVGERAERPGRAVRSRPGAFVTAVAGFALPILAWGAFSSLTGAPFLPTHNHENLALTYFADDDRISGDARLELAPEFTSTFQVLSEDPARIVRIYARDLVVTTYRLLVRDTVLPFPLVVLGLLSWVAVAALDGTRRTATVVLLLNLAAMYFLLNFKAYEDRYYVFLVPFIGAAIGHLAAISMRSSRRRVVTIGVPVALAGMVALGAWNAVWKVQELHREDWSTDAYAAAGTLTSLATQSEEGVVYARKPHVAHYAEMKSAMLPQLDGVPSLVRELADLRERADVPVYVFYGVRERSTRPELSALDDPARAERTGLTLVAQGEERGGWTLYAVASGSGGEEELQEPVEAE